MICFNATIVAAVKNLILKTMKTVSRVIDHLTLEYFRLPYCSFITIYFTSQIHVDIILGYQFSMMLIKDGDAVIRNVPISQNFLTSRAAHYLSTQM